MLHLVDANGASADLPIRVAFNAGTIVPQTTLTVTGNPADPDWLAARVTSWVARLTRAMPGATMTHRNGERAFDAAAARHTRAVSSFRFRLPATAEYFDQSGTTTVDVQNASLQPFSPALLFYDDDPEHVSQDGVLFRGTRQRGAAGAPLLLSRRHRGSAHAGRRAQQQLAGSHLGATRRRSAGPNMDVMHVGQTLTKNFLADQSAREGVVVNLSQDEPYLLADVPMAARQLVSGTVDLRVLSGGPVVVTVLAVSAGGRSAQPLDGPVLPGDGHHRTGVFKIAGYRER